MDPARLCALDFSLWDPCGSPSGEREARKVDLVNVPIPRNDEDRLGRSLTMAAPPTERWNIDTVSVTIRM